MKSYHLTAIFYTAINIKIKITFWKLVNNVVTEYETNFCCKNTVLRFKLTLSKCLFFIKIN